MVPPSVSMPEAMSPRIWRPSNWIELGRRVGAPARVRDAVAARAHGQHPPAGGDDRAVPVPGAVPAW